MTHEFSTRLQAAVQKSLGTDAIEDNGLDFVFIFFSLNLSDFLSPKKLAQELPRAKSDKRNVHLDRATLFLNNDK